MKDIGKIGLQEELSKKNLSFVFGIWIVYAIAYYLLKTHSTHKEYAGFLSTAGDTSLNIIMILFNLWLWKNSAKGAKRIFGFFTLSFAFVTIPNALYQLLFNVFAIKAPYVSTANAHLIIHHVMYAFCLLFEFMAWASIAAYIFPNNSKSKYKNYIGFMVITGIILLSFLGMFMWKINHAELSASKCFEIYITSFYITNFILAMLCLAICKSKSLFYLALGYLVIVGADLIMVFGFLSQNFGMGSLFDTSWVLGLLLMLYGVLSFKRSGDHKLVPRSWLFAANSIKTQSTLWSFILCTLSLVVFLIAEGFFNFSNFFLTTI